MKKYKVGYTCGVFDLFHVGHLNLLERCKEYCDTLIVGVCDDKYVTDIKHKEPVFSQEERVRILNALKAVDRAELVNIEETENKMLALKRFNFDVLFSGDDWKGSERYIKTEKEFAEYGVSIEYLPYTKGYKHHRYQEKNGTVGKVRNMSISREQFDALTAAYYGESIMDSATKKQLEESGYIKEDKPTEKGLSALEPYRVKSAVFLAAGLGSRLMPLTKDTPKPLVKVFGKSFIERLLDACVAAEIEKIYIVVGHLKEKFYPLKEKYPQIEFIENPKYDRSGTLYSVYCALDKFENTYLLESDLLLSNMSLVRKYNYRSAALGIKVDKTDDWCWIADKEKRATWCKMGGEACYLFEGIVYFDKDSSKILKSVVKETVENIPDGEKWDISNAIYTERLKDYYMEIRECQFEDIIEIDSYEELKAVDKSYK